MKSRNLEVTKLKVGRACISKKIEYLEFFFLQVEISN